MIILLSVLFLLLLVWWGIKLKEGMTIDNASTLIQQLDLYNDLTKKNKETNTNNNVNAESAYTEVLNLNITDTKYSTILDNVNLNESSKLNSIYSLLEKDIVSKDKLTVDQFKNILDVYNNSKYSDSEKVIEITNITNKDPRFSFLHTTTSLPDDAAKLSAIKTEVLNILNTP
jgi:hypothetical protein